MLSQCDIEALAFVFAWALEGTDPAPPDPGPFVCTTQDEGARGGAGKARHVR